MTKKAIFFDFDGTLADTQLGIIRTMQQTFRELSMHIPTDDAIRNTIGLPLFDSVKLLNDLDDTQAQTATDTYRRLFPQYEVTLVSIFPEVKETLQWLEHKGIRMSVVTSRNVESLDIIMNTRGIAPYFETHITASDNLPSKPAPDMIYAMLKRMQLSIDDVMMVGDTTFDIDMGNNAGCTTVAVTYGNHSRYELENAKPTFIIDTFSQLKEIMA